MMLKQLKRSGVFHIEADVFVDESGNKHREDRRRMRRMKSEAVCLLLVVEL